MAKLAPITKTVTLPNGQEIQLRKLTQGEVETLKAKYSKDEAASLAGLAFIANRCTLDTSGARIFQDSELEAMKLEDFDNLKAIAAAVIEFSGLTEKKAESTASAESA